MDKILNELKQLALNYKSINKLVLFGSRARKDNTNTSDYDIAIFANNIQADEKTQFINDVENISTLNKIDLVFIKDRHIGTELYNNILKDGVEIMNKFQNKFENFQKALNRLKESVEETKSNNSSTLKDGTIQRFEFTAELAWKTAREYLLLQEISDINNPKSVMSEAFNNSLITDDVGWLQILRDRNSTSHIYDEEEAAEFFYRIVNSHIKLFEELVGRLEKLLNN